MHVIPVPKKLGKGFLRSSDSKGAYTYCVLGWVLRHTGYDFNNHDAAAHLSPLAGLTGSYEDQWREHFYPFASDSDKADRYSRRISILRRLVDKCPNLIMEDG